MTAAYSVAFDPLGTKIYAGLKHEIRYFLKKLTFYQKLWENAFSPQDIRRVHPRSRLPGVEGPVDKEGGRGPAGDHIMHRSEF